MTARPTPHAMPTTMATEVEMKLGDRDMSMLDSNARFIVRALIAESYAKGFQDGYWQHQREAQTDRDIQPREDA